MTIKEAIEMANYLLEKLEDTDSDDYFVYTKGEVDALRMAIEALQKQEPRKPRKNNCEVGIMFWKMQTYTCPKCGNQCLTPWMNERNGLNYCWDCGQRIDWEETASE